MIFGNSLLQIYLIILIIIIKGLVYIYMGKKAQEWSELTK
jgi:hypothetical protein